MTRRTDWPGSTDDEHGGYGESAAGAAQRGGGGRGGSARREGRTWRDGATGRDGGAGEAGAPDGPPSLPWSSRDAEGPGAAEGFGESGRGRRGTRGSRSSRGSRGAGGPGSTGDSRGSRASGDGGDGGDGGEKPPQDPAERARSICLRLLTGTPRTRKQLADALHKRDIPEDVSDEVLSRFEEVGLINDAVFADAWVESRHHSKGLARRALARELRTKGVEPSLIDEAVGQLDSEQEEATARELVARKLRSTRGLERDKRLRRLAGMLARKGYPEGLALRLVRQALEEEGEDTDGLDYEPF
ncbi:recombination regulator RecX [Streptomyces sp. NPDC021093]|uniref:recombination regulator RecX n=1 Tax=Streptomyces sp. NPDC021093 TaxID=3365112 RepID=UPI0037897022